MPDSSQQLAQVGESIKTIQVSKEEEEETINELEDELVVSMGWARLPIIHSSGPSFADPEPDLDPGPHPHPHPGLRVLHFLCGCSLIRSPHSGTPVLIQPVCGRITSTQHSPPISPSPTHSFSSEPRTELERTRGQQLYFEGEGEDETKAKGAKGLGGEGGEEDEEDEDEDEVQGAQERFALRRWLASGQSLGIYMLVLCELGVVWYVGVRGVCESALLRAFSGTPAYPCGVQSHDRLEGR